MSTEQASTPADDASAQSTQTTRASDVPSLGTVPDHRGSALPTTTSVREPVSVSSATARSLIAVIAVFGIVLALGVLTFNFDVLRELATVSGVNPTLAWLWPLIVDGFILIATAAAAALRGRGPRATLYSWATLILFSAINVAGNGLHASNHADYTAVSVAVAAGVSAVPALALTSPSHLMVVLLGAQKHTTQDSAGAAEADAQGSSSVTR